jgi:hypothetical protein
MNKYNGIDKFIRVFGLVGSLLPLGVLVIFGIITNEMAAYGYMLIFVLTWVYCMEDPLSYKTTW